MNIKAIWIFVLLTLGFIFLSIYESPEVALYISAVLLSIFILLYVLVLIIKITIKQYLEIKEIK